MTNPRFPHTCIVYRRVGATSFNPDGELNIVYEGECRKSSSTNIRTFNTGQTATGLVDTADHRVSMPGIVKGIQKGDLVDVTDLVGMEMGMRVVSIETSQLCGGGTAVLCNLPSN